MRIRNVFLVLILCCMVRTGFTDIIFKNFILTVANGGCDTFFIHARKAYLKGLDPKKNRTLPPLNYEYVYSLKREFPELNVLIKIEFIIF
mgnify:CR=1 FL=1